MTSDEIRESYLRFFEERGHMRIPSASLVPSAHDPSALLTVAGMHPLKPYFLGEQKPPAPRLTDCQKCFRTVDIDRVGATNRHLTFFEMLGNFSLGDYFKEQAIEFAWELSREVLRFPAEDIWVTVFEGDAELGLGPDEEAIEHWVSVGVPRERIVLCPRSENFWQAGPTGPCGPCSELYLDRGVHHGRADDLPGEENERFLEYWNLVFMQYNQDPPNTLTELPARNIDTGLGLNRLAAILQEKRSVFETDQFWPLIELGQELSGARYGEQPAHDRALRILADHSRAMTFLVADGVVPSNEDRGYVLRRVMRRAIHQGRVLEMEPGFLLRYAERVRELMAGAYPELQTQREAIEMWLASEEESFSRTLAQGLEMLRFYIDQAHGAHGPESEAIRAEDAFRLHDTYGFPYDLTRELLAEEGMSVDEAGFERLMEEQRSRARLAATQAGAPRAGAEGGNGAASSRAHALELVAQVQAETRFTGYETEEQATTVEAVAKIEGDGERRLVKLADSPFYATGGGQVSDTGVLECEGGECAGHVASVLRLGDDQAVEVVLERGDLAPHQRVLARVDHPARHATECNHTATHLLHAALRARLGTHVRQAGSYVGPDKLRFDFTHTSALTQEERDDVADRVNAWIAANDPVHPVLTTREEAERLGAMALFGEKYGDVVRMVEIGGGEYSRELCGGTHVRSTSEIGVFHILSESSSAANVRRIEALTGPAAVALLRERERALEEVASVLRTSSDAVLDAARKAEQERRSLQKAARESSRGADAEVDLAAIAQGAQELAGGHVLVSSVEVADPKSLLGIADRLKGALPPAAIVLGAASDGRVHLLVSVAPELVERGVKAGAVVKAAAEVVGGGGGGRDTLAQAGGRDPERLPQALERARETIAAALAA